MLDLLEFADEIVLFAIGKDSEREDIERMRYPAIERLFELIGESLNRAVRIEPELAERLPDTRQVIGMRNRLTHEYDGIDPEAVWDTAVNDVPQVIQDIKELLDTPGEV